MAQRHEEMAGRRRRRPRRGGGFARSGLIALALVVVGVLLAGALPSLNPFGTDTIDRSQPAVLKSIEKLSEYHAATANLQVIVDVEKDAKFLPGFLKGEKTLLVAAGQVDGVVDFGDLGKGAVQVDEKKVTITLPPPALSKAQLDLERTRVFDRERGLIDRIGSVFQDSPTSERELLLLAEKKLYAAAQEDRSVLKAAEGNTRAMLTNLMQGLGFTAVTVRFTGRPHAEPQ
jgi:hypothetical protein